MSRTAISAFLVTLNEAEHISAVIDSLSCFEEVVVVDSGSTDGTAEIARRMGATVYQRDWLGYSKQKALAAGLCKHDWLFNVDGDEVVPPALAEELIKLAAREDISAIKIPINDFILGEPLHRLSRKRKIIRMFKRGFARYPEDRTVHENLEVDGAVVTAHGELHHFGYSAPEVFFAKQLKYAVLRAQDKYRCGKRGSIAKLSLIFPFTFIKVFLIRGLVFSGYRGLVVAMAESVYAFSKELQLLGLRMSKTHE